MDFLEQVLDERAGELAAALTLVGFSHAEASRFLDRAGPELIESYRWQAERSSGSKPEGDLASELLAGMRGRTLADQVGLPAEKTWAGLRELVPTVLEARLDAARRASGRRGAGQAGTGPEVTRMQIGFGLTVTRTLPTGPIGRRPAGAMHPVFGRLLTE